MAESCAFHQGKSSESVDCDVLQLLYFIFCRVSLVHKGDPRLSTQQIIREAKHAFRIKYNLDQSGMAKVAMTKSQRQAQCEFIEKALEEYHKSFLLSVQASAVPFRGCPFSTLFTFLTDLNFTIMFHKITSIISLWSPYV